MESQSLAPIFVGPEDPPEQGLARQREVGSCMRDLFVVSPDGVLLGFISRRRMIHFFLLRHKRAHTRRELMERAAGGVAGDLMEPVTVFARPEEELGDAIVRHLECGREDLPVLDEERHLLGVVNLSSVVLTWEEEEEEI